MPLLKFFRLQILSKYKHNTNDSCFAELCHLEGSLFLFPLGQDIFPLAYSVTLITKIETRSCKHLGVFLLQNETYDRFNSHTLPIMLIILQNVPFWLKKKKKSPFLVYVQLFFLRSKQNFFWFFFFQPDGDLYVCLYTQFMLLTDFTH